VSGKSPDNLKPLPKPVRLEMPTPGDTSNWRKPPPRPEHRSPPDKGLSHFEQAQRSHGYRRPAPPPPKKKKKPPGRIAGGLGLASLGVICVGLIVLGIVMLMSNNALAVYVNGERIGYLPLNRETRDWDPENIQAQAVAHRARSVDAAIRVNERVSLEPVRANRRYHETLDVIIREVSQIFTYQIEATAIYVGGEHIAIMRTRALAEHVANWFINAHRNPDTTEAIIEGWEYRTVIVSDGDLMSADAVIERLDREVETIIQYIVREGDNPDLIRRMHGITLNRLLEDNNLPTNPIIRPGDVLDIRTTRPFLSVRTTQDETRTEVIPMEVIRETNDQMALGDINILQEGREGERTVVVRMVFINGQLISEEIISATITTHPETRIVEEGTSTTAMPDWR